jgi:PDDEXK-like uncharacterized protein DUF3799
MESSNIIRGLPFRQYATRALGEVSNTGLRYFMRTPRHYWHWSVSPDEPETKAKRRGGMLHAAMFDPALFARMVVQPYFGHGNSNAAKAAKAEWVAQLKPGSVIVDESDRTAVQRMAEGLAEHPFAAKMCDQALADNNAEITIRWSHDGLLCKARLDGYLQNIEAVMDLKSCMDASPEAFARDVAAYRYDIQAAFYRRAARAAKLPWSDHIFACVENAAPHVAVCYSLDKDAIDAADDEIAQALKRFGRCVDNNEWPGHSSELRTLYLPKWHMDRPIDTEMSSEF